MIHAYKCLMFALHGTHPGDSPIPTILCSAIQVCWSTQPR